MSPATWQQTRACFETIPLGEAEVRGFEGKIPLYTAKQKITSEVKS
jgi:hypothetical protein